MIELLSVSKSYTAGRRAVDGINLTVENGEIFGFLGPNGAGKTTAIKMMTGILKPDSGAIRINGEDIAAHPMEAKRQIGFVPDNPDMFTRLKGLEYLNFIGDVYDMPVAERIKRINTLCSSFEMESALGDRIQSYSHGMRQKMVIIGALMHDPAVWILDEPMTGLDPKSAFVLKQMMRDQADAGRTVFFSTHVLEVAEKLCDRVAIIDRGRIQFCGTMEQLKTHFAADESLEKIFLEITEHE